jgi:hypothetical protein
MEPIKTVADYFLKIGNFVFSVEDSIAKSKAEYRKRASIFLGQLADLLESIITKLESREEPIAECMQLNTLMYAFPEFIMTFKSPKDGDSLLRLVTMAHDSPASAVKWLHSREKLVLPCDDLHIPHEDSNSNVYVDEIRKLKEAVGKFRATGQVVGLGLESMQVSYPGYSHVRSRVLRYVGISVVLILMALLYFVKNKFW